MREDHEHGDAAERAEDRTDDPREMDRAIDDERRHLHSGEVPDDEVHEEMITDHDG